MNPALNDDTQLVAYTQKVFRSLLDSMARPGTIKVIEPFPLHYQAKQLSCAPFVLGIANTLFDIEVGFNIISPGLRELGGDLEFHTAARAVSVAEADYILMTAVDDPQLLQKAQRGSLDYPDGGATVIMLADYLHEAEPAKLNSGFRLNLQGPGVLDQKMLFGAGVAESFFQTVQAINAEFPLGLDLILVNQERIVCLPRSLRFNVQRGEA